jgi:hypothetical protein
VEQADHHCLTSAHSARLPDSVKELIDVIGFEAALALVRAFPGIPIKVPVGRRPDGVMFQRLVEAIGRTAAERFVFHYGGESGYVVPRCAAAIRAVRDAEIIAKYDGGANVDNLARKYRLSVRQIRTILKRGVSDDGQIAAGLVDDAQLVIDFRE